MLRLSGDGMATALYDPATQELFEGQAWPDAADDASEALPDGWYRWLGATLVVFYGAGDRVWLRVGDVTRAITSPGAVDWFRQADVMARLSLVDEAEVVASVDYFGGDPSGIPPELDFTMTSTDDFDFGEFVRRKLDDERNLRRLFGAAIQYDAAGTMTPRARAALDALPRPIPLAISDRDGRSE